MNNAWMWLEEGFGVVVGRKAGEGDDRGNLVVLQARRVFLLACLSCLDDSYNEYINASCEGGSGWR
ncbi:MULTISPECIES: hypothetical protein [Paraburkholderia]|uniref:Transposase n=1 Tax=Paraburkholderia metrosideri TaxID=580937 RepID=A0ABW9DX69_9BURK